MTIRGRAPGPLLLVGAAAATLAFVVDSPILLSGLAVGALVLHLAAPRRSRFLLLVALTIAVTSVLLNPFVQANGDLILFELPDIPLFDTQVTLEEVVAGITLGFRAFAVTLLVTAALALADPDRLLALAGRLLPRSALAASIAARMLPLLERDAHALRDTVRLRGHAVGSGPVLTRARGAAALAMPLVGSALERSLDTAEAMAARGYGGGPRTRLPEAGWDRSDRVICGLGTVLAALAVAGIAGAIGRFDFYPTMDPGSPGRDVAAAVAVIGILTAVARMVRR